MRFMITSSLAKDLERDEGRRSKPYKDTEGFLTIGVGHNLDSEGLCKEAIDAQLDYDIRTKATDPLDRYLSWWREHPEGVQRALGNLCFNLGIAGLLKFKDTLSLIRAREYKLAAAQLLTNTRYHQQIGQRLDRIAELIRNAPTTRPL